MIAKLHISHTVSWNLVAHIDVTHNQVTQVDLI